MPREDPATLDIMNSQLRFQDFTHTSNQHATLLDNMDSDAESSTAQTRLLNEGPLEDEDQPASSTSFWSVDFYQRLFDVDTSQVLNRLRGAVTPCCGNNFLQNHIGGKPDLYGPFWICTTLVFSIAISGNIANYLQAGASNQAYRWKYDFHAVTLSATAIFSYAWLLPLGLWGTMKWIGTGQGRLTFIELVCVYGYSLAIYVPVSILWVIQISWLQWLLVIFGAGLSGMVLIGAIWPAVSQVGDRRYIVLITVLALHSLLAAGFMLYFFHVPEMTEKVEHAVTTVVVPHRKITSSPV